MQCRKQHKKCRKRFWFRPMRSVAEWSECLTPQNQHFLAQDLRQRSLVLSCCCPSFKQSGGSFDNIILPLSLFRSLWSFVESCQISPIYQGSLFCIHIDTLMQRQTLTNKAVFALIAWLCSWLKYCIITSAETCREVCLFVCGFFYICIVFVYVCFLSQ